MGSNPIESSKIGESNKGSSLVSKTKNGGSNPPLPATKLSCDANG